MGSAALKLSPGVGKLLRFKRNELNLTLRQVSERAASQGEWIPSSTLARIEQGKLDPGVRRLNLLLKIYQVPPHLIGDLIELEDLAVDPPLGDDLQALYTRGRELWLQGDIPQGLAHLFAVRLHVPTDPGSRLLQQKATLTFATMARNLGKHRLARQVLDELLCDDLDGALKPPALILAASVWGNLGAREVALAMIRQARMRVADDNTQEIGWVLHQEAKLALDDGSPGEAERILLGALEAYRQIEDTYGLSRGLILMGRVLERVGRLDEALARLDEAIELCRKHRHRRVEASASIQRGRILALGDRTEEGIEAIGTGLAMAIALSDRVLEFHAHYQLWKAHERIGDLGRAAFERTAARHFIRFVDDVSPESREVRALTET